ncbi:MAG: DNA translocase FtsK [Gemmatimonadetes bacterium]|nr:DNA translocase FtsK [Gemmatimonadota bacterium]
MAKRKKAAAKESSGADAAGVDSGPQSELLALALFALGLFLLLALLPVSSMGAGIAGTFPSGNAMGRVGTYTAAGLWVALGAPAVVVPALFLIGGLRAGAWLSRGSALRLGALAVGLLVLVPPGLYALPEPAALGAGWLGTLLGRPLTAALDPLGTVLLVAVLLSALTIVTLGWRPVRVVGQGVAMGGGAAYRGMGLLGGWWAAWREAQAQRAAEEAAAAAAALAEEVVAEPLAPFERETGEEVESVAIALPPLLPEVVAEVIEAASPPAPAKPRKERARPAPVGTPEPEPADPFADKGDRRAHADLIPPIELLTPGEKVDHADMEKELDRLGDVLVQKLRTFNVESHIGGRTSGPVVTQFEVVPAAGVKVNRIANLDADLALAMKAQSVRIVAPIPGKGAVGVEIPNPEAEIVQLRDVLEAKEFKAARGELPLALGRDLTGKPYVADLAKMPHLLIAGATGSGKSVCINTIITSLVYRHTPETLRMLMIDPKMVELSTYSDLPHLRHAVVTDPRDAAGVLKWAVLEMERRYELLSTNHVRSIGEFNKRVQAGTVLKRAYARGGEGEADRWIYSDGVLPFIVVVVDELADLMMTVQSEIEKPLAQLAQKARAIGIHLIVATQRPSVNVITGLIKANFPTRIAFRVASKTDSRTILDQNGSEALLGNGDMLFLPPGKSEPARIQGAYIATEETEKLLDWFRERAGVAAPEAAAAPTRAERDILEEVRENEQLETGDPEAISGDWDELFRQAAEVCIQHDQGSTSLLQRRLKIGYGRAARIVDQLHEAGVLGPPDGSKPRDVLMSLSQLEGQFPGA